MTLVPIPWQPELKLTPSTLALLAAASKRVGRDLYLYGADSAWRSYASQKAKWDAYQKGGVIASNPDTGQRSHMRGAAFDLRDTSTAVQKACRAVGLIRDPKEPWHWNDPNWRNMPIILTDTSTAGLNPKPLQPERKNTMTTNYVKTSTGDKKGGAGSLWATAGDAGSPCPGNWLEFTRTIPADSLFDRGRRMADVHGNGVMLTDAEWDAHKKLYTTPAPVGSVTLDSDSLVKALAGLGVKIDALPAEIDRYADGKKQS